MRRTRLLLAGALAFGIASAHGATFVGPTRYLSQSDSPFVPTGTFHLDDFEDNALNTPGVSASSGSGTPPNPITDSVDADDGVIDGFGKSGHSFFSSPGASGIRFTFDAGVLGSLPTAAGIVWTDGTGEISFEAFGALGTSIGTLGPEPIVSNAITGETDEDRFFGVYEAGGISAIFISNTTGGIEVDHLQYGAAVLGPCASVPSGPTFASLNCRLSALIAQVAASSELGAPRQARISKTLAKAKLRKEGAEARCLESKLPAVKGQIAKAVLGVVGAKKTLGQTAARRNVPPALREELVGLLEGLQTDLRTLRRSVRCPDDAN